MVIVFVHVKIVPPKEQVQHFPVTTPWEAQRIHRGAFAIVLLLIFLASSSMKTGPSTGFGAFTHWLTLTSQYQPGGQSAEATGARATDVATRPKNMKR